ncbi:pentatricopeptide repeat-containing protein 1, mitochondrial [Osmerus eperlanus]|uniref:pentatricopeptide repeat-containing protein 1, mitochondrial n=1 Tax=Osmerus eperlanus TaxID=29151 RepID=UPI002E0E9B56
MFPCVSRSCLKNGRCIVDYGVRYVSVPTTRDLSTVFTGKGLCPFQRASVTDTQWKGFAVSVSMASDRKPRENFVNPVHLDLPRSVCVQPSQDENELPEERFGTLSGAFASKRSFRKTSPQLRDMRFRDGSEEDGENEDTDPVPFRSRTGRRNTPYWYFLQCKKLIKENKLSEALELFQEDMLRGERLQPEEFNYTLLIGGCGRSGNLKLAFRLYNHMKKRGLVPTDATYTALFNACAESPWKQAGLQQALRLEQELRRKNHTLNDITFHALLKTHALTNHLRACLHTLREILQSGHAVTQETFHYLIMGCVRDREAGFRLALQVWRQMLRMGLRPDLKNYNLLLRAARDCGIGDTALASALLLTPEKGGGQGGQRGSKVKRGSGGRAPLDVDLLEAQLFTPSGGHDDDPSCHSNPGIHAAIPAVTVRGEDAGGSALLVPGRDDQEAPIGSLACQSVDSARPPNLLDLWVTNTGVVSLGTVTGASDRLALVGGAEGVLEKMATDGCRPDVKTLSLLADTMEPGSQSLLSLLQVAKQHKVKLDVAFFNSLIRRVARAGDLDGAKEMVCVMTQKGICADMQTYGGLALGCVQKKDGLQLLKDMEEAGLKPSVHVFSALIGRAARRLNFLYLKEVIKSMKHLDVPPNDVIIKQLELAAQYPPGYDQYKSRNNYLNQIDGFRGYYQQWLSSMPAQETPSRPWEREQQP